MKKQKDDSGKKYTHRDCRFCKPFTEGFFNAQGEPILGTCEHVPHKVIMNDRTNCKQWRPTEG